MKVSHASICFDGRLTIVWSFAYDHTQTAEYGNCEGDWGSVGDVLAPFAVDLVPISWRKFTADSVLGQDKKEISTTH